MRARSFLRSASVWIGGALVLLIVLQLPPFPGVILMMFAAPLVAGALVHVFLAALLLESTFGRIPRVLIAIPLLAYGAYYAAYFKEGWAIRQEAEILRSAEPGEVLHFDSSRQSLVMENARWFVQDYDVPVAYQVSANVKPEGYVSNRLLPRAQCATIHVDRSMIAVARVAPRRHGFIDDDSACVFSAPERPSPSAVTVTTRGADAILKRKPGIAETDIDFALDGRPIATYRAAYAWRLPSLPWLYIGCSLDDGAPAWRCGAGFVRTLVPINSLPDQEDALYFGPVAATLGISKVQVNGLHANPQPVAGLDTLLANLTEYPERKAAYQQNEDRDLFASFARFLDSDDYPTTKKGAWTMLVVDGKDEPPRGLLDAVIRDPSRLVPLRDKMIAKLVALRQHGISEVGPWLDLPVQGLMTIPKNDFAPMSDSTLGTLLQYLTDTEAWRKGVLYVRAADVGARTSDYFAGDLKKHASFPFGGNNPALAICRIGQADDATRDAIRQTYLKTIPSGPKPESLETMRRNSAYFVTLLALGEEQFLRDHPIQNVDRLTLDWYALVLAGKGRVDGMPNNCRGIDRYVSRSALGAGLGWRDGKWMEAASIPQ
jgi:hypothetical protein